MGPRPHNHRSFDVKRGALCYQEAVSTEEVPDRPGPGRAAPDPELVARLATIGQRFLARLLDALILALPILLLVLSTSDINQDEGIVNTPLWAQLLSTVAAALYEVVLIRTSGQTIGKRALRIRVVRITDGRPPDWTASIMRYLLPILPALVPLPFVFLLSPVVYLVAMLHPLRQGWHDRAAGTIVVKTDPGPPPQPDPPLPPPPPPPPPQ